MAHAPAPVAVSSLTPQQSEFITEAMAIRNMQDFRISWPHSIDPMHADPWAWDQHGSYIYWNPLDGPSNSLAFNVDDGFLEASIRGNIHDLLKRESDYVTLGQCETLEDMKLHLQSTAAYGAEFLRDESGALNSAVIHQKCIEKLAEEFEFISKQAVEPLMTFFDFLTHGYMIENVLLLLTGAIHGRDAAQLMPKCHPLGRFKRVPIQNVSQCRNMSELYDLVLQDTPLGRYFVGDEEPEVLSSYEARVHPSRVPPHLRPKNVLISKSSFSETELEKLRCYLWKRYLHAFFRYCWEEMKGVTWEAMRELLMFEADRRLINIARHVAESNIPKDERKELFPGIGYIAFTMMPSPGGGVAGGSLADELAKAAAPDAVLDTLRSVKSLPHIHTILDAHQQRPERSLEDHFFEYEVALNLNQSVMRQFSYGIFYSWLKLKEQEIRNLLWIAECITQREHRTDQIVTIDMHFDRRPKHEPAWNYMPPLV